MSTVENCGMRMEHPPHSWFEGIDEHHYCDGSAEDEFDDEDQDRRADQGAYDL